MFPLAASIALHAAIGAALWFALFRREPSSERVIMLDLALVEESAPCCRGLVVPEAAQLPPPEDNKPTTTSETTETCDDCDTEADPIDQSPNTPIQSVNRSIGQSVNSIEQSSHIEAPVALATFHPVYPRRSKARGEEGTVKLRLKIDAGGSVAGVSVEESSGHRLLDEAAVKAAWPVKFSPATSSGLPVETTVVQPVRFSLRR